MEASRYLPEGEPEVPQVTLRREVLPVGEVIFHFFVSGEESSVTIIRDDSSSDAHEYTYRLHFFDWEFAEADVTHTADEPAAIEWRGIVEDLEDLAAIQARKLLSESDALLLRAIQTDFPGPIVATDVASNR